MTYIDLTKPHRTRDGREVWLAKEPGPEGWIFGAIKNGSWDPEMWARSGAHFPLRGKSGNDLVPVSTAEEVITEAIQGLVERPEVGYVETAEEIAEEIANALREAGMLTEGK